MSQYTAKERKWWTDTGDLWNQIKENETQLKAAGSGLSESVLEDIVNMGWSAAWHSANKIAGWGIDSDNDYENWRKRATSVANSGYFTETEVVNLK
jgi:hypothetical protein